MSLCQRLPGRLKSLYYAASVLSVDSASRSGVKRLLREAIWEHLGNWFHENRAKRDKYRKESIDKWDDYASIGFMPEDNLILTFGSFDRDFNIQAIHRKAAMMAFPPPVEDTIAILRSC